MIWPSHAHVNVQHQTNQSDSIASGPHSFILLVRVCCHWARLWVQCKAWSMRETRYGCKHLVLPCSTFTHGITWLGSIGLTNGSGHSIRSMSTTLFWAKQGTSTLVPVGNVYVDDVTGNRSCASIFVGQESDTVVFGFFPDTKGSCEKLHARAASAPSKTSSEKIDRCGSLETSSYIMQDKTYTHTQPWIWFASPPCTSHSKNRNGVLSPDGPDGKEVLQTQFAPSAKDMQRRDRQSNKTTWHQSVWLYWPIFSITASICVSNFLFWPGSCLIFATQASQIVFLFLHSLRLQKSPQEKNDEKRAFFTY